MHASQPDSVQQIDAFDQESDATRTLLLVIVAVLARRSSIAPSELDAVFSAGGDLVRQRWGPHSAAGIVINGCRDDLSEALAALGMSGAGGTRTGLSPASTEQRCEAGNAPPASRSAPVVAPAPGS